MMTTSTESNSVKKIIWPPEHVKGIKHLDRDLFRKLVSIPFVVTDTENLPKVSQSLKPYFLRIFNFKPVQKYEDDDSSNNKHKIFLNPDLVDDKTKTIVENLQNSGRLSSSTENAQIMNYQKFELAYEHFNHITIFRSVFPDDNESLTGFSTIGHIIHLNLRDHMLPYKNLIGQVLLDKIHGSRLIVNKLNVIDSKFRNFKMEILAQDPNNDPPVTTVVSTTESDIKFKFDFAKVYWNPRLSAERTRIIDKLKHKIDIIYDVFAGVGPFSVTAAKIRKCKVLANDLNPDSYHWLIENVKLNKVHHLVQCFNMDGRDFIRTQIKNDLIHQIKNFDGSNLNRKFHVLMNLPEIAFEFLNEFNGLLSSINDKNYEFEIRELRIHCYCFLKNVSERHDYILQLAASNLGHTLSMEDVDEILEIRKVAPNKLMYRLSFRLKKEILYGKQKDNTKIVLPKEESFDEQKFSTTNHKRLKLE